MQLYLVVSIILTIHHYATGPQLEHQHLHHWPIFSSMSIKNPKTFGQKLLAHENRCKQLSHRTFLIISNTLYIAVCIDAHILDTY